MKLFHKKKRNFNTLNQSQSERRQFSTDFQYSNRETELCMSEKKYQSILSGKILDVGADECHLKKHLPLDVEYIGIGLGGNPDIQIDLEREQIPFPDRNFDCVLCLDVLEHLDNIHSVFDELCRVSANHVVISLPNPWASLYPALCQKDYRPGQPVKYYGLPPEPPEDRHKWFFSVPEAEAFLRYRADKNYMNVIDLEVEGLQREPDDITPALPGIRKELSRYLLTGTIWAVLKKRV